MKIIRNLGYVGIGICAATITIFLLYLARGADSVSNYSTQPSFLFFLFSFLEIFIFLSPVIMIFSLISGTVSKNKGILLYTIGINAIVFSLCVIKTLAGCMAPGACSVDSFAYFAIALVFAALLIASFKCKSYVERSLQKKTI